MPYEPSQTNYNLKNSLNDINNINNETLKDNNNFYTGGLHYGIQHVNEL